MSVIWPANNRTMSDSPSSHWPNIVGWSVKTVRCPVDVRPVIGATPVKTCIRGLRTMSVIITDVLRTTWPMRTYVGASLTPLITTDLRNLTQALTVSFWLGCANNKTSISPSNRLRVAFAALAKIPTPYILLKDMFRVILRLPRTFRAMN